MTTMSARSGSSNGHQNPAYCPSEDITDHDLTPKDDKGLPMPFVTGTDIWAGGELTDSQVSTLVYFFTTVPSCEP